MFNGTLIWFQERHEENLLKACAEHEKIVLKAPTGSGKTVLVTKFIDDYLDENPDTVFFWLCPGAGNLQDQSRSVFERFVSGVNTGDVYNFISDYHPEGGVYFVNWDKITKETNIVLKDGETKNLPEKIAECRMRGADFFMVVDEEHRNKKSQEMYEGILQPTHILRMSATPEKEKDEYVEQILDDEVISAGLIASGISINENIRAYSDYNDNSVDDLLLLKMADDKRKQISAEYKARNLAIKPLVLIQFPVGSEEWIIRIKKALAEMGYNEKNGLVTSWFSGDHPENPEELAKLDGQYAFLLFKQAIATGWDCPRAKILVKLREGGTEQFQVQTVGRIRRMPEKRHYESELLDHCYVYTLDEKFTDGLTSSITSSFYIAKFMRKENTPSFLLEKEFLAESDRHAVDEEQVVLALRNKLLTECDLDNNGFLSKKELEFSKGFVFGTTLKSRAVEGIARTTNELAKLQATFCGTHEIDLDDDGIIIRDAKRKIARAIGIDEKISSKALTVLFDSSTMKMPILTGGQLDIFNEEDRELDLKYKVIRDMGHKEYFAFLVNNWEILAEMLKEIDKSKIVLEDTAPEISDWHVPKMQEYKKHKNSTASRLLEKNIYEGYATDILVTPNRSEPEIMFEQWCECSDKVEWFYKNGDKGKDYFSLVYRASYRHYNFYPDYLVKAKNGDTWIIEVKGGEDASGNSANIDEHASYKLEALKEYGEKHPEIKWGFARNIGTMWYISNTEWTDTISDHKDIWKPLYEVFK